MRSVVFRGWREVSEAHLSQVARLAADLFQQHDLDGWSFEFDRARTRAGLCNYQARRITLSSHYVLLSSIDDARQVLLHEIAHALVGKVHGHGPVWRDKASDLGYLHQKIDGRQLAEIAAPWLGVCPGGHQHFRYRRPVRVTSCMLCSPRYSLRYRIEWQLRQLQSER